MHDELMDQQTAAFLDEVRATFEVGTPPSPHPELAALFVSGLASDKGDLSVTAASNSHGSAPQTSGLPNWTRRHIDMLNDVMEQVRSKAVAAAAGAALVLSGLGATGALNAPLRMIGLDSAPTEACAAPTDPVATDPVAVDPVATDPVATDPVAGTTDPAVATDPVAGADSAAPDAGSTSTSGCATSDTTGTVADATGSTGTTAGTVDQTDTTDAAAGQAVDPAVTTGLPAVPTSVSEAAHIHDFDVACGNHGAYVSHMARFGEEPECATTARGAAAGTSQDATTGGGTAPATNDTAATGTGGDAQTQGAQAESPTPPTHGQGHGRHAAAASSGRGKSGK